MKIVVIVLLVLLGFRGSSVGKDTNGGASGVNAGLLGVSFFIDTNNGEKMTGKRNGSTGDFAMANAEMKKQFPNFTKPDDYTWHHLDDFDAVTGECTMQLVKSSAHQGLGVQGMAHSGSVAQWKAYYLTSNNAPNNLFYQQ